jgi:hypothetical protein
MERCVRDTTLLPGTINLEATPSRDSRLFQTGNWVRLKVAKGRVMLVEGYDNAGRVLCSYWKAGIRIQRPYPEPVLERQAG